MLPLKELSQGQLSQRRYDSLLWWNTIAEIDDVSTRTLREKYQPKKRPPEEELELMEED